MSQESFTYWIINLTSCIKCDLLGDSSVIWPYSNQLMKSDLNYAVAKESSDEAPQNEKAKKWGNERLMEEIADTWIKKNNDLQTLFLLEITKHSIWKIIKQ